MLNKEKILNALNNKSLVKIISGIQNYDKQKILTVAMAAELGGATALDICDEPKIIQDIRAAVSLPIFISSIEPEKLIYAQKLGADALELGNFESFYKQGKLFTPQEILDLTKKVIAQLEKNVLLSVTVPATLELANQIKLANELVNLGVDIIQTEGFVSDTPASDRTDSTFVDILKAASTLANTFEIKRAIPKANIITASGITLTTLPLAKALGASGIGIGTFINSLTSQVEMTERVKELVDYMDNGCKFATKDILKEKVLSPHI